MFQAQSDQRSGRYRGVKSVANRNDTKMMVTRAGVGAFATPTRVLVVSQKVTRLPIGGIGIHNRCIRGCLVEPHCYRQRDKVAWR